jgi:predicted 3-demethylubiquinone-9 3-methyltransferase (glyoxalase superfamily)
MTQKITPFLWFDRNAEEAVNFYVSVFKNSKIVNVKRYPEGITEGPMAGFDGKVLTAVFELEGQRFMALDGGPVFKFNPSVSFIINCSTSEEVDEYWNKLSPGGNVMMELQEYPFSKRYGWLSDKYGVSWQIGVIEHEAKEKITPSFMFVGSNFGKCEEAINFYTSTLKNSSIEMISRYAEGEHDQPGKVKFSSFILEGQRFHAMESSLGHKFDTTGAISFLIECNDQPEIDYYWDTLTAGGDPNAQQCGWLKDKYGFSWQVTPDMTKWMNDTDKEKSGRAMQAMLQMKKIDIAGLEKAYNG